jgi:hypothetical protein
MFCITPGWDTPWQWEWSLSWQFPWRAIHGFNAFQKGGYDESGKGSIAQQDAQAKT